MRIGQSLRRSHAARQEAGYGADCDGEQGFTLFEMILVITIVGITASIALPVFSDWRARSAVDNAAMTLLANFKQARVKAMAENRSVSITFTSSNYTFDADLSGTCGLCKSEIVPFSQFSSGLKITKNNQTQIAATQTFKSHGTTGSKTIYLCDKGFSKRIVLNLIGRAYLCTPSETSTSCTKAYTCT